MSQFLFTIECPNCGKRLKSPPELVGQSTACPRCQCRLHISPPKGIRIADVDRSNLEPAGVWKFKESHNPIDDSIIRVATAMQKAPAELNAILCFRATLRGCSVSWELYFAFAEKVFSIREDLIPARVRVDRKTPRSIPIFASERGDACFLRETWEIICELHDTSELLCEMSLMKKGTSIFQFPVDGFASVLSRMFEGAISANWRDFQQLNRRIVEYVLRIGPMNLEALIEALSKAKVLPPKHLACASRKTIELFVAAQKLGEKHHVSEIYGVLTGNELNDPFSLVVRQYLSQSTREATGKLYINE